MSNVATLDRPRCFLGLPAPAKLNLFLHILGRRPDGYHEIESVFVPLDLCDTVDMELRTDGRIVREGDLTGPEDGDLAVRAARALQKHAAAALPGAATGVTLRVQKRIPVGAGLGGGSSDAATTLIGLNRLWRLGLDRPALAALARGLGADVPFFLGGGAAFVSGIGEQCAPVALPAAWYVLVYPQVHVSTAEIFADPKLTRDSKQTTIAGFSAALRGPGLTDYALGAVVGNVAGDVSGNTARNAAGNSAANSAEKKAEIFGRNDLEAVVRARFSAVDEALCLLDRCGGPGSAARMSGSGSAVFRVLDGTAPAHALLEAVRAQVPAGWSAWAVAGLPALPLAQW
jgi:4-diphosphocytidyl-2-C-methyl-D-erythritol kinase